MCLLNFFQGEFVHIPGFQFTGVILLTTISRDPVPVPHGCRTISWCASSRAAGYTAPLPMAFNDEIQKGTV